MLASDHVANRGLTVLIGLGIGAAWIGTGLYACARRPANRVGALMTWTGCAWLLNLFTAADAPALFTAAVLASNLYLAAFVHLLVAYPDGCVKRRRTVGSCRAGYAIAVLGPLPFLMFGFDAQCTDLPGLGDPGLVGDDRRDGLRRGHDRDRRRARRLPDLGPDRALARREPGRSGARWRRCCGRASC